MSPSPGGDPSKAGARLQDAVGEAYEILGLVGRGGFAEVFEARDPRLDRRVAVKVLRADLALSPEAVERFQREARSIARLRHPHVIDVYTVGEREGVAYFVMPLLRGETLEDRLEREGRLPPAEAERILMEAAAGLGAAHRAGLVHRDVKPDNILFEGDERRVVLTDFGIAKAVEEGEGEPATGPALPMGTPHYLSPEQVAGEPVDARSDLYALGIVAYRMVAGRLPVDAPTPRAVAARHLTAEPEPLRSVRPECPETLAGVVHRCLAKDPADRFEDTAALLAALRGERGDAASVPPADEASAPRPGARRDGGRSGLVASILVAVGAAGVDLALTGGLGFSLPVVLLAGAFAAAGVGRAARTGRGLRSILVGGEAGEPGTAEDEHRLFGPWSGTVRESRACRASILRLFHGLSRAERSRFPGLPEAVDALAAAIRHDARRLAALEERAGGRPGPSGGPRGAAALEAEITEAGERTRADLAERVEALERIRHWLVRSGGADSEAVHDQLVAAVGRAREAVRRRDA